MSFFRPSSSSTPTRPTSISIGPGAVAPDVEESRTSFSQRMAMRLAVLALTGFLLVELRSLLVPLVLALLFTFLLFPMVEALSRRGVKPGVAIVGALFLSCVPFVLVLIVLSATVGPLQEALPKYQQQLTEQAQALLGRVLQSFRSAEERERIRQMISDNLLPEVMSQGAVFFKEGLQSLTKTIGYFFLTLLLSGFMLVEARRFQEKFSEAFGDGHPLEEMLGSLGRDVRAYLVAKTWISALTGAAVWLYLEIFSVDFAAFWGLVAFPLNFIPTVGAVVASIPPILVVLVDPESTGLTAAMVAVGLLGINGVIGSYVDPRYVGHALRLSPLIIFLSMLVWGVLWGPVGMILAAPMMVSVKLLCKRVPALRPIATLMKG